MAILSRRRLPALFSVILAMFAPSALAHDMTSVAIAFTLVLAIPIPALIALVGWKKVILYLIPIGTLALWFANAGSYGLMYGILLSPYLAWIARTVARLQERDNGKG